MDLLIQHIDEKKSLFESFMESRVVSEIISEIRSFSGMNVIVLDSTGHIIIHYNNSGIRRLDGSLDSYMRNTIRKINFTDRCFNSVRLAEQEVSYLVCTLSPDESQSGNLGFMFLGPFKSGEESADEEIPEDSYGIMEFLSQGPVPEINSLRREELSVQLKMHLRLMHLLYHEKFRNRKNLKRMSGLYQINSEVLGVLELEQILNLIMKKAVELLEAETGVVMMLDEDNRFLRLVSFHGRWNLNGDPETVQADKGLVASVFSEGTPRLVKGRELENINSLFTGGIRQNSVILVPVMAKEKVIGAISIAQSGQSESFDDEDLEVIHALVSGTAAAIDNAQLYTEIQKKVREFGALFDLSSTIVSTLDRKEVLAKVLDNAIQLLHAGAGSLMLLDKEKNILEIEVAHGLPEKVIRETRIPLGEGISGKVALEGKPRLLKKGIKEAESKSEKAAMVIPSALSVPMMFHSHVIGVLNVKGKSDGGNFTDSDMELLKMLANQAAIAIENARLHKSLEDLFVNSIRALANAIEARDPYTRGHSERVTEYSVKIAQFMGMEADTVKKIRYAALLHDIGKINIKEEILNKPGKLTDEEFSIMNKHPTLGAKIMEPVKEFRDILPIMYHHHERFGSGGYPDSISGEQIPFPARILAVADAFDAMTSDRPYRKALPLEVAVGELKKHSGTQFDPRVVEVFLDVIGDDTDWILDTMQSGTTIDLKSRKTGEVKSDK